MGYDMQWVEVPEDEAAEVAQKTAAFYAACNARDDHEKATGERAQFFNVDGREEIRGPARAVALQNAVNAASIEMYEAERSYFRLNIWGMAKARTLMVAAAMAFDVDTAGDWPGGEYDEENDCYVNQEDVDRFLAQHPGEFLGIPLFKLGSNDGWIVTPAECRAAVAQWLNNSEVLTENFGPGTELGDIIRMEWWPQWLAYLGAAAEHGGFRVY